MKAITIDELEKIKSTLMEKFSEIESRADQVQSLIDEIERIKQTSQDGEYEKEYAEKMMQNLLLIQDLYSNLSYLIDEVQQMIEYYYRKIAGIYQQLGVKTIKNGYKLHISTNEVFIEKKDSHGNYQFFLRLFPARSVIRDIFDAIYP